MKLKFFKFHVLCLVMLMGVHMPAYADEVDSGLWLISSLSYKASSKIHLAQAFQLRTYNDFKDINQALSSSVLKYHINDHFYLEGGVVYMLTRRSTWQDEFRLFQGGGFTFNVHKNTRFHLRHRFEERVFFGFNTPFGLRTRSLLGVSQKITNDLDLKINNEVFFSFYKTDWGSSNRFDQNRIIVGLQYKLTKTVTPFIGYMNQHIVFANGRHTNVNVIYLQALFKL